MPELIEPTVRLHEAWIESRDEWGRGVHQPGAGLRPDDDVDSAAGFATWVARLRREADTSIPAAEGLVHCTYRWIVDGDRLLGTIALRHTLNDFLLEAGGHIGYGIRPSERGRGLATFALGEIQAEARKLGLDRLMISCDVSNPASARVIERHGGILEDIRETPLGTTKRYWVAL
ncbi:GNAT family N-acetyltransferase [Actinoplanes aureus]|uniref:GNAT family N-acetyltransferase n=1 Tax=Actinoplanes aureus TaxID=2792083 RepID=A0A931FWV3_9ACTN|nr:GNAT family N-acetyltransferase [Actinoplanes aureus]MBG0562137.1 GNAT family N-acetyltransferase [Actinoplanes aureus]